MDDRALARGVIAGDPDAIRLLVERESTFLLRVCQRVLGDLDDAADAAQESLIIGYRSIASWRGEGSLRGWLAQIAIRQSLRHVARRARLAHLNGDLLVAAGGTEPHERAEAADRAETLRMAVAALPEPYREALSLRFFAELSLREISEITGRPIGTVKTHLRRGLRQLRDVLSDEDPM